MYVYTEKKFGATNLCRYFRNNIKAIKAFWSAQFKKRRLLEETQLGFG